LLDRLTHHVTILAMNGDSYRLKQATGRRRTTIRAEKNQATPETSIRTPARSLSADPFAHHPPSLACFYSAPLA